MITDLATIDLGSSYSYNPAEKVLSGLQNGFIVSVKENSERSCYGVYIRAHENELMMSKKLTDFMEEYKNDPLTAFLKAYKYEKYTLLAVIEQSENTILNQQNLRDFINAITKFLNDNYYAPCCAECGETGMVLHQSIVNGVPFVYCDNCRMRKVGVASHAQAPATQEPAFAAAAATAPSAQPVQAAQNTQPDPFTAGGTTYGVQPDPFAATNSANSASAAPSAAGTAAQPAPEATGGMNQSDYDAMMRRTAGFDQAMAGAPTPENGAAAPNAFGNASTGAYSGSYINAAAAPVQKPNIILGIIGGLLFSLIGIVIWVLIARTGFISWIGGLAVSLSIVFGYRLFAKRITGAGIAVCVIEMILAIFIATFTDVYIDVYGALTDLYKEYGITEAVSVTDTIDYVSLYITDSEGIGSFLYNLILGLIVTGVSGISYLVYAFKRDN